MLPAVETVFAVSAASALRQALGTVYFSFCSWDQTPLMAIDWSITPIETGLPTYVPSVFGRLQELARLYKAVLYPEDMVLYAEAAGFGKVVMLEAHKAGHDVREVREDIAELDLDGRATQAMVFMHAGQVKLAPPAFEKTQNFKGTNANHLLRQIKGYRAGQEADAVEVLNAWCTGTLLALQTGS